MVVSLENISTARPALDQKQPALAKGRQARKQQVKAAVQEKPVSAGMPNRHRDARPRQAETPPPGQRTAHLRSVTQTAGQTALKHLTDKLPATAAPIAVAQEMASAARRQEPADSGTERQAACEISSSPSNAQGAAVAGFSPTAPLSAPKGKKRIARGLLRPSAAFPAPSSARMQSKH